MAGIPSTMPPVNPQSFGGPGQYGGAGLPPGPMGGMPGDTTGLGAPMGTGTY